jgi:hypothetical protein
VHARRAHPVLLVDRRRARELAADGAALGPGAADRALTCRTVLGLSAAPELLVTVTVSALVDA